MADLGGHEGPVPPPPSKFFQFHAVLGEIWQNHMLAPPGGLAPHLREILDSPLYWHECQFCISIYSQFHPLIVPYDVSKCEIRCEWT